MPCLHHSALNNAKRFYSPSHHLRLPPPHDSQGPARAGRLAAPARVRAWVLDLATRMAVTAVAVRRAAVLGIPVAHEVLPAPAWGLEVASSANNTVRRFGRIIR